MEDIADQNVREQVVLCWGDTADAFGFEVCFNNRRPLQPYKVFVGKYVRTRKESSKTSKAIQETKVRECRRDKM
jgi:hypothetical protein